MAIKASGQITIVDLSDARTYWLSSNTSTITRSMSKTLIPSTVTFNSYYRDGNSATVTAYSGRFIIQESTNGTSWTTKYTSSTNESSKTYTPTNTTNLVKCTMYVAGGTSTALDSVTIGIIDSIDDLQVGGRNILPYSSMKEYFGGSLRDINYYSIDNNKIIATNQPKSGPLPGWKIDVIENQQFTLSGSTDLSLVQFYMKGFDSDNNQVFEQRGNGSIGVTNSNFKYTFSISNAPNVSYIHLGVGSVSVANYWIQPKLEKGNVATDWSPASEDIESNINSISKNFNDFLNTTYAADIQNIQNQIDGAIQFWNGENIPTLSNYPANEWTTEEEKINHQADIYTVITDVNGELKQGKSYRFDKVNGTWQWIELTDNELSAVQAIAQSKAKVFINTPIPPYDIGDLWIRNQELYKCKTKKDSSGTYAESDWEKATKYTDDTKANEADKKATSAKEYTDAVSSQYGYRYKADIVIHGDSDKYYPVYVGGGNQEVSREIMVRRGYWEQAPSDWNTSTHKGALMLRIKANYGGWGGATYKSTIIDFSEMYSTMLGDVVVGTWSGMCLAIYLRGGGTTGAIYHLYSDQNLTNVTYNCQFPYVGLDSSVVAMWSKGNGGDTPETAQYKWYPATPLTTPNTSKIQSLYIDDLAKKGVAKVDVEYYLSTSNKELSGGSWSTTAPNWVDGKFMWSRTKTVNGSGTVSYKPSENGTCIAGAKGSTGATGKGINSIKELFYVNNSSTTVPTLPTTEITSTSTNYNAWTTVCPTWQNGYFVWTASQIKYTDNTFTWTTPMCSSEWIAVNEIDIGGRNLLLNSNFSRTFEGTKALGTGIYAEGWRGYNGGVTDPLTRYHACIDNTTFGYNVYKFDESNNDRVWKGINQVFYSDNIDAYKEICSDKNAEYMLSLDVYQTKSGGKLSGGFHYQKEGETAQNFYSGQWLIKTDKIPVGSWKRLSVKVPYNNDIANNGSIQFYIYGYNFTSDSIVYIKNVKLEKGNIATAWSPAPEDVENEILQRPTQDAVTDQISQSLKNATESIDQTIAEKIGQSRTEIDKSTDKKIEAANKSVKQEIDSTTGEKIRDLEYFASQMTLKGNEFSIGIEKTKGVNLIKNSVMKQHKERGGSGANSKNIKANFWLNNSLSEDYFPNIVYGEDSLSRSNTDSGNYFRFNLVSSNNTQLDYIFSDPIDFKKNTSNIILSYKLRQMQKITNGVFFIGLVFYRQDTSTTGMGAVSKTTGIPTSYYVPVTEYSNTNLTGSFSGDYIYKTMPITRQGNIKVEETVEVKETISNGEVTEKYINLTYAPSSSNPTVNILSYGSGATEQFKATNKKVVLRLADTRKVVTVQYIRDLQNFVAMDSPTDAKIKAALANVPISEVTIYYNSSNKKIWTYNPFTGTFIETSNLYDTTVTDTNINTVRVVMGVRSTNSSAITGQIDISDIKLEYDSVSTIWTQNVGETYSKQYKMDEKGFSISSDTNTMFIDEDEIAAYKSNENGKLDMNNPVFQIKEDETILRQTTIYDQLNIENTNETRADAFVMKQQLIGGKWYFIFY